MEIIITIQLTNEEIGNLLDAIYGFTQSDYFDFKTEESYKKLQDKLEDVYIPPSALNLPSV